MPYAELQKLRAEAAEAADLRRQLRFQAETHKLELDVLLAEIARLKGEKAAAKRKRLGSAEDVELPRVLEEPPFPERWEEYLAYRRNAHPGWSTSKPWAERNLGRLAAWARDHGVGYAVDALSNSMDWQGIFPAKGAKRESEGGAGAPAYHRPI